jgi:hypothetical protein
MRPVALWRFLVSVVFLGQDEGAPGPSPLGTGEG